MAYRHFTRCVDPADWKPRSVAVLLLQSLILVPFTTVLALAEPWCLLIVAEIWGLSLLIAYCRHFLYHRLICLDSDHDAIGAIVSIEEPRTFHSDDLGDFFDWDNDYSINLLLQNTDFGVLQPEAEESEPFGHLIKAPNVITDPPLSLTPTGAKACDEFGTGETSAVLHAEFEGAGIYDLMQIAEGMLGFAIAALLACVFLPWPLAVFLAIAALLGLIIGAIAAGLVRPGDPEDVNPDIGTLHTNDSAGEDGRGRGADIVYVFGTWVHDALHDGWNEIHPIKVCTKVNGTWDGDWLDVAPDVILRARHGFDVAQADETRTNQALPEHQWEVHPVLDGCSSSVID